MQTLDNYPGMSYGWEEMESFISDEITDKIKIADDNKL